MGFGDTVLGFEPLRQRVDNHYGNYSLVAQPQDVLQGEKISTADESSSGPDEMIVDVKREPGGPNPDRRDPSGGGKSSPARTV